MIWSSLGLFLAVALVNTQGLSIQGEEHVSIQGDEVEQELDVSRVVKTYKFQQETGVGEFLIFCLPGAGGDAGYGGW